ncbi:hypothetical protein CMV_011067 [Castanea mollissima]|uniref:Uncharacterized protein n=1 Tax=Castanea mollissima TaxID=60419 RepID=A0A8J4R4H8_9ROSI|nr:hypothetical protein CMV_011067 [Castanea mollissima]
MTNEEDNNSLQSTTLSATHIQSNSAALLLFHSKSAATPTIFRGSKAYHWSLGVSLSLAVHLLKLCIKLVPRLIHTFIRISSPSSHFLDEERSSQSRSFTPLASQELSKDLPTDISNDFKVIDEILVFTSHVVLPWLTRFLFVLCGACLHFKSHEISVVKDKFQFLRVLFVWMPSMNSFSFSGLRDTPVVSALVVPGD